MELPFRLDDRASTPRPSATTRFLGVVVLASPTAVVPVPPTVVFAVPHVAILPPRLYLASSPARPPPSWSPSAPPSSSAHPPPSSTIPTLREEALWRTGTAVVALQYDLERGLSLW